MGSSALKCEGYRLQSRSGELDLQLPGVKRVRVSDDL
jgi:hypothetical protein